MSSGNAGGAGDNVDSVARFPRIKKTVLILIILAAAYFFILNAGVHLGFFKEYITVCKQDADAKCYQQTWYSIYYFPIRWFVRESIYFNGFISVFSGIAVAIFTGTLWVTSKRQAELTRDSIKLSRDVMIADQRPWVFVGIEMGGPIVWYPEASITFNFSLENTGRTPALNVQIIFDVLCHGRDEILRQQEIAERAKKMPIVMGITLFPNKPVTLNIGTNISESKLQAMRDWWKEKQGIDRDWFVPVLIGCVAYDNALDPARHQTGFIRQIVCRPDANGVSVIGPSVGDIPAERLIIATSTRDGITD